MKIALKFKILAKIKIMSVESLQYFKKFGAVNQKTAKFAIFSLWLALGCVSCV